MEILFDNPFIVLILAALFSVSSVFKKAAENQKKNSNQPPVKKTVPKSPFDDVKEIFKEVARNFQEEQPSVPPKKLNHESEEKNIILEQPVESREHTEAFLNDINKKERTPEAMKQQNLNMEINDSKLIQSIVWSEILGPPRSKKPYYRSRK